MSEFLLNVLAASIGFILANYIQGLIFAAAKANQYEDVLADKIARRVKQEMESDNG